MQHRIDQLAARKQPVPGPLPSPDEPFEIQPRPQRRRWLRRPRRWLRSLRRWPHSLRRALRTRRGRWRLAGLGCAVLLIVALLAHGFGSSSGAAAPGRAIDTFASAPTSPAPSSSAAKGSGHTPGTGPAADPLAALRAKFPDNPLNHLRGAALHRVSVSVSSEAPVLVLGYLIPTGLGASYGEVKGHPHSWSMSERAIGRGYLAAIFVQAGRDGRPVRCRVVVDGRVTDSETTSGSYGRAICLG